MASTIISKPASWFNTTVDLIKRLDVQHGKPQVEISTKRSCIATGLASFLFVSWGLAYGLLDIMNYHVKVAMNIDRFSASLMALAYYMAYWPGTLLIGAPVVKKCGYRAAFIVGLLSLAIGMELMSLGAKRCSFAGMVVSQVVVGLGVSTLERSANPYVINCGARVGAVTRILFAQSMAGVGTVIAPFLAKAFVFDLATSGQRPASDSALPGKCLLPPSPVGSCGALGTVITFYRALGGCVVGLAALLAIVLFRTTWLPEVAVPESSPGTHKKWQVWKHPLCTAKFSRVWVGVAANFVNLGCQVTLAQFFIEHVKVNACASDKGAADYMAIAQGLFVAGRLAAAGLDQMSKRVPGMKWLKPRLVLLFFLLAAAFLTGAGVGLTGKAAIALVTMAMFFEAPSFPMIFEAATAQFDEYTPDCETLMILSISGGGILPMLMGKLVEGVGISKGWWLEGACFGLVTFYPALLTAIPSWRRSVDQAETGEVEGSKDADVELVESIT